MKVIKSKKALVLLATLVVAAAAAIGAYAYFTSTGNGTGSASVGTASNTWVVGQTGVTNAGPNNGLFPDAAIGGANIQTNSYHVKNNGHGSQQLANVAISVANSDGSTWFSCKDNNAGDSSTSCNDGSKPCTASDFSVDGKGVGLTANDTSLNHDFTAGEDDTSGSVTIEMIDNSLNQDNCQGVTVPLYFAAS